ncbi:ABC transporter ATP-binding protein [Solimonas sp. K1W22B-7]|uniref:ABC transporter ATP-binding protein n=1 Tax=Solimonas sp. K1W22B-7 TaxID=2303331 RepID=UPI000E3344CF|nr:ABC transporter ATP-binding protein [Solimonas sp. K1W22B-7]AXQ28826.1 ABC transporter ATP-binding protein [Solimonas sp. K1W22B-7]
MTALLQVDQLSIAYGGIHAVKGISLHVDEGELVTLIGANGAGKTTTLNTLGGLLRPAAGRITYNGQDLARLPAHERVGQGLALVPEGRGIFSRLTVTENLQMGAFHRSDKPAIASDLERSFSLFPRLKERESQLAGTLSGGEQQMLAIGRALMSRPRLLLLDEPSMGLAPLMVEKIFSIIREINSQGVAILLIEQNARLALAAARRAYVLESGCITLAGPAAELAADERVRAAYLGH